MSNVDLMLTDGPRLACRFHAPNQPKAPALLLAHGLLSCKEEFDDFPERMAQAGYGVMTFDFQGHGLSDGLRSYHTPEQHEGDLKRAYDALRARPEVDPEQVFLVGHSLGTVPVLRLMEQAPAGLKGGVLMAPPVSPREITPPVEAAAYWLGFQLANPLFKAFGLQLHVPYRVGPKDVYLDPAAQARGTKLGLIQKTLTLNNYTYLMTIMNNARTAQSVRLPALVVVAKEDQVVPNDHSRRVFESLASPDKEWVRLSPSGHSMMGDTAKDTLLEVVTDWLSRHLS